MKTYKMKNIYYISKLLVLCILLGSCTSEALTPGSDFSENAFIHLSLTSNKSENDSNKTRANGPLPTDNGGTPGGNEKTLNHICAALFNSDGNLVTIHEYDYISGTTETIMTRKDATQILVFANIPSGAFSGKYTISDFYTASIDLGYTTSVDGKVKTWVTTANSQNMKALPMMSPVQPLHWLSNTILSTTANLTRVISRVAITGLTTDFSGPSSGCSFTPTEIFMYNANNQLTNWNSKTATGNVSGEYITSNINTLYLGSGIISTYSGPYYFYVFPHDSDNPTKLVIKGQFTTNSGITYYTYYPITINSRANGNILSNITEGTGDSKISQNTTYSMAVTLNGTGVPNVSDELIPTNVTVTTSVTDFTKAMVPSYFGPKIGDIFYSDGSYSSTLISGKTPVAIVFSTTTSATDNTNGFIHGYAMALKNAGTGVIWGPGNTNLTGSANTTLNITDYDGFTYTGKINDSNYPAAYAAATTFKSTIPIPSGTSGWYLPSIGQWYQICINLGGMSSSFNDGRTGGYLYWSGESTACANALNTAMSKAGSNNYDAFSGNNESYWCSSEFNTGYAYRTLFGSDDNLALGSIAKVDGFYARPVLAF
ncbi:hypothetical protein [Xylanibacter oryzae]|uniref:hypothetical protein n=1 Tax=Xylanibacter oryzae TaxID=185293 RepID=UPI0004B312EA|nr:hypothetical protein [Xylanibacter oryzae]